MYNVKHMIIPGIEPSPYCTVNEDNDTLEVKATHVRFFGDKLYCEIPEGWLYTIPTYAVISVTHEPGTPRGTDEDAGGAIYHQYNRDRRTPTGIASFDSEMLALWLWLGYDVVVESFLKDGITQPQYITNCPEFLVNF